MEKLQENIGYKFKDQELLKKALTHTSYAYEHNVESNEKLEFLGDSILEFISSIYLYKNYPKLKEGEMTKVRATVVCEKSLYKVAKKHNFSDFLYLGKSERLSGGENRSHWYKYQYYCNGMQLYFPLLRVFHRLYQKLRERQNRFPLYLHCILHLRDLRRVLAVALCESHPDRTSVYGGRSV